MTEQAQDGSPLIDVDRILADANELSFPRFPGTSGDHKAIEWLVGRFRETGVEVTRQDFSYDMRPAWRALRALLGGAGLLLAAAGLLAERTLVLSGALVTLVFVGGGVFLAWAPGLERLYQRPGPTRTANVVGRRRAANPRLTLVFLAHHDSKSQNLTLPVRATLTFLALTGSLALAGLLAAAWLSVDFDRTFFRLFGVLAATALLALSTLKSGNDSPGGVDNAGSVGILLELARLLPSHLPQDIELIFLSPGAEEDHMVGAMRWLDENLDELNSRSVFALNFDGAGIPGRVVLLERFGFGKRFSPVLSRVARKSAGQLGLRVRGVFLPPAMGVDAIPFAHRGVDCLTLASGSLGRAVLAVHSAKDKSANLDGRALAEAAYLGFEMAQELAESRGNSEARSAAIIQS